MEATFYIVMPLAALLVVARPHQSRVIGRIVGSGIVLFGLIVILDGLRADAYHSTEEILVSVALLVLAYFLSLVFTGVLRHPAILLGKRIGWLKKAQGNPPGGVITRAVPTGLAIRKPIKTPPLRPRGDAPTLIQRGNLISLLSKGSFIISLNGVVDKKMRKHFRKKCHRALESGATSVRIELNSRGGFCHTAMAIRYMIRELSDHARVEILVTDSCQSAAVTILTSVPLENRYCFATSAFMIHRAGGGSSKMHVSLVNAELESRLASETSIETSSLKDLFKSGGDYYFSAQEALRLGVVGHLL